ncbi:dihydrolipoyl dehydrogenase [Clostridium vitabionis]|uniref:dihydrolipoyl dehydrogenase n=1 Tax=Clostridium vitabionis TaxID=2784388 RepID=UPI00188A6B54|nr:dihydrolipoyl dehydrogenase [Clostridium vitabionis]
MEQFDILVIGGGPGGYSLSLAAAKAGMKVALFEKERVGGTCLNVGCIPTKYLLDKAITMEKVRSLVNKDIFRDAGTFSFKKIQSGSREVVDKLVGGVQFLLKKNQVTVVLGTATLKDDHIVTCCGKEYQGKYVVIATGSQPMPIPIPGHELCIDSTGALNLKTLPRSMVVIGGGVIGLELACAFSAYGTEVTIVELMPELLPVEQKEAVQALEKFLKQQGISLLTGTKVLRVEETGSGQRAVYEKDGKEGLVDSELVLMAAGRKPNFCGIDTDALKLAMNGKYIAVDAHQRTNLDGVYAIGDVAGGYQLAHAAYAEAEAALADILGQDESYGTVPVPVCIYTIPCFATVGLTTEGAKKRGYSPCLGSFDYNANGMALAEGASGSVYVVMDKITKITLGVTVVGENASEMIAFGADAVRDRLTLKQWKQIVVAHPSLCEMLREAALDAFGISIHKG